MEYKNPQQAFEDAIAADRLSANPNADNYAGKYMYMGSSIDGKCDAFKHIETREYLKG